MLAAMREGMPGGMLAATLEAMLAAMKQPDMPEAAPRHFCRLHCLPIRKV